MDRELLLHEIPLNSMDLAQGEIMRENPSSRDDVLGILRKRKADFADAYGVTAIGIFGSFARGQEKKDSDIDIVVKMKKPDLFYMVHIKEELEGECRTRVDIVHYREKMNAFLKNP